MLDIKDGVNVTENMTLNLAQVEESCEDGYDLLMISSILDEGEVKNGTSSYTYYDFDN